MTAIGQRNDEVRETGDPVDGSGSFLCTDCSYPVSLAPADEFPECPNCGSSRFRRASIFESEQPTLGISITRAIPEPADWLQRVRDSIPEPGKYLAMFADGRSRVIKLRDGWSRIGRSGSADIRLNDPTVSRRHAVIVKTAEGELRVLDDRSTNGICVNEALVDWSPLCDGDELQIGRYTLHVVESAGAPAETV
jgi:DNA-directed RNA polymerase subunit RPC12/RpoP